MKTKTLLQFIILGAISFGCGSVLALTSDKNQPVALQADNTDIDFKSGKRTYTGNVKLVQGSLKLVAELLEVHEKNDKLEKAIAKGEPAVFRQRPDGENQDIIGRANFIVLDEVNDVVTFTKNAHITLPDGTDFRAKTITYNLATEKLNMSGGTQTTTTSESSSAGSSASETASTNSNTSEETTEEGGEKRRAKITLKPKTQE